MALCGVCAKKVVRSGVACDTCDQWFHVRCENLKKDDMDFLMKSPCEYHCSVCTYKDGMYDYKLALIRLEMYASTGILAEGIR
jgi:hypothetical protein